MNEVAWCYLEGFGCKKDKVSCIMLIFFFFPPLLSSSMKVLLITTEHVFGPYKWGPGYLG